MGRGDQRTKRGKISRGTSGKTRPSPKRQRRTVKAARVKKSADTESNG